MLKNKLLNKKCSIENKVMDRLASETVTPKPRYSFIIREFIIVILCLFGLILGSLTASVIIFLIQNNDWDVYTNINDNILEFTLLTLPYLWIIFLVLLINIIQQGIKHTNKGYKLNPIMLLSITIILSSILGTLLFYNGIGYQIDNILNNNSPRIHKLMNHHARTWSRPNKGFLSGEIIEIYSNSKFNIIDLNKKNWVIMLHEEYSRNPHNLFVGQRIRILGKPKNNKTFMAWKIMPLNFRGCPLTKIYKEKIIHKRLCPILKSER